MHDLISHVVELQTTSTLCIKGTSKEGEADVAVVGLGETEICSDNSAAPQKNFRFRVSIGRLAFLVRQGLVQQFELYNQQSKFFLADSRAPLELVCTILNLTSVFRSHSDTKL